MKIPHRWFAALVGLALVSFNTLLLAAPFTPGNIVVYRVGPTSGGAPGLTNVGNAVFLDEYETNGTFKQTVALPTTTSGPQKPLIQSGTATSNGQLNLSGNKQYLLFTGYGRDLIGGTGNVTQTASATVPRVVGRVKYDGTIDTSTALTTHGDADNTRSAASIDGTTIWVAGASSSGTSGGVHVTTLGATTSTDLTSTSLNNARHVGIFDGQLYLSSSSGTNTFKGVSTVGTGLPVSGAQTVTRLPGLTDANSPGTYAFCLLDLSPGISGVDTLYIADDGTGALTKFSLVAGTWTANGTVGTTSDNYTGLACSASGGTVSLFATRNGTALVKLDDASGYNGTLAGTPTVLVTAAANTVLRGVSLTPEAPAPIPEVNLSVSAESGTEAGQTVITVTATASAAVSGPQTVSVSVGGVNITGADYLLSGSTITIPDTQTTGSVTFTIQNDSEAEGSETAVVTIGSPSAGITLGAIASKNITIIDDELLPVTLNVSATSGTEALASAIIVTVSTNNKRVSGPQTVELQITGTGITAGDYTLTPPGAPPYLITIPNDQTSASVTFTIVNDGPGESAETATLTLANPSAGLVLGAPITRNIDIIDAGASNAPPTIACAVSAFSGVISDPTNPTFTCTVGDAETPVGSLSISATSGNTAVVPSANVNGVNAAGTVTVTVSPTGVGYSTLTITVTDGETASAQATVNYAASAASLTPSTSRFHIGIAADASTAIAVDSNYMFVANDENQRIGLYSRTQSGPPVAEFNFTPDQANGAAPLGLNDQTGAGVQREIDIEAATKVGNRIYWLASHGNSRTGNLTPNRYRVFSTDVGGSGAGSTLTFVGRYDHLRTDLINWDVNNVHGLGANHFGLQTSAASGVAPEDPSGGGFNIEGLVMAPGSSTTAYLSFRAPISPASARTKALIVPVTNFAALVDSQINGGTAGTAVFGAPILLDLGERGIREIAKNASNQYLIVAGPADGATGVAPKDFRFFTWDGNGLSSPVLRGADLTALQTGGSVESIVEMPAVLNDGAVIQILSDNGDTIFYGDGIVAKELTQDNHKKFRSDTIALGSGTYRIHHVQGSGNTTPFAGTSVVLEGIVTGVYQSAGSLGGFYMQESDADADPATSEGIFVSSSTVVAVGDKVRVTGTAIEEFSQTKIKPAASVTFISGGNSLPAAVTVNLPVPAPVGGVAYLERFEGMRVNFLQQLTVTEHFQLAQFGQVVLSSGGRLQQPTSIVDPNDADPSGTTSTGTSNVAAVQAQTDLNLRNRIMLDDGNNTSYPSPIPFWDGTVNTLRSGTTVDNLTGIIAFDFSVYRVLPTTGPTFGFAARPAGPPAVGAANLKVGSFNVLNYFNGNGTLLENPNGGWQPYSGTSNQRGAHSLVEFNRQWPKTVAAINSLGAAVVGLLEMENDGTGATSAIVDLVGRLNTAAGPGTWAFVSDPTNAGNWGPVGGSSPPAIFGSTDAIKPAIITNPAS